MVLASISARPESAGVTSFVRLLRFDPKAYPRFLHFFRSSAVDLDRLTSLWLHLVLRLFRPIRVGQHLVCIIDGIKVGKEGKRMPAVRSLHQQSSSNSKPSFIMGHSFEAASLLVQGMNGHVAAIPLLSRIHEGLVWSNRDHRTLLDKAVALVVEIVGIWGQRVLVVADAYYGSRKVILPLLQGGHHLVTRARSNAVGYRPAARPKKARRGRPKLYGQRVPLKELANDRAEFQEAASPIAGERSVRLRYRCEDLLWRPIGRLVRFVIVKHPSRGLIILMTTHLELDPLEVYLLYSHRFKIEVGFRQGLHVLGSYAYRFWMKDMDPTRRGDGNKYLHRKSQEYRDRVREKLHAYHLHVQLGCIAQGLMLHLSLNHTASVWGSFRGWMRTMNPKQPPSELVTAQALRDQLPELLACLSQDPKAEKFLLEYALPEDQVAIWRATG